MIHDVRTVRMIDTHKLYPGGAITVGEGTVRYRVALPGMVDVVIISYHTV